MPDSAQAALTELGLPYVVDQYPNPWFTADLRPDGGGVAVFDWPGRSAKLYRIGLSAGDPQMPICVNGNTGEVIQISASHDPRDCFVNSDLRAFIELLYTVSWHRGRYRGCSDEEALAVIPDLEQQLRLIDPRSLDDPTYWWSEIIEQMKDLMF